MVKPVCSRCTHYSREEAMCSFNPVWVYVRRDEHYCGHYIESEDAIADTIVDYDWI